MMIKKVFGNVKFWTSIILFSLFFILISTVPDFFSIFGKENADYIKKEYQKEEEIKKEEIKKVPALPPLDTVLYDKKMMELANNLPTPKGVGIPTSDKNQNVGTPSKLPKPNLWPVKTVYPNSGAILPFKRVIAYYGNLYSKQMGALGEYPEDEMLSRLMAAVKKWEAADPQTPVMPALHYIAVVAQES